MLATALLLVPRFTHAQGLRSPATSVTLHVTAPPERRAPPRAPGDGTDGGRAAPSAPIVTTARGPAVADATLPLPALSLDMAQLELRAEAFPDAATAPAPRLYVRDAAGALRELTPAGIVLPRDAARHPEGLPLRVVSRGGDALPPARWRLQLRLVPRDPGGLPVVTTHELHVAPSR